MQTEERHAPRNPPCVGKPDMQRGKEWLYWAGAAVAGLFWVFTIYGLPPRVDKLEARVQQHEEKISRQDVKLDIVLDDVKTIKSILMQFRQTH